ncbi:MAG: helix-turn-helix transcriptional regulator [Sandaracinaceae bacterium]
MSGSGTISAAVAGAVIAGLRQTAPGAADALDGLEPWLATEGGVPLGRYRSALEAAWEVAGAVCILRSGVSLRQAAHPILFVLLNSDDVGVLVEKEARLRGFIHSRHAVDVVERGVHSIRLRHRSLTDEAPHPGESLAAAGQHLVLFEELGCQGLSLRFPHSAAPERFCYAAGMYDEPVGRTGFEEWDFVWCAFSAARRPFPGLDELLLAQQPLPELRDAPSVVAQLEQVLRRDLGRTWRLAEVAEALGTSARSLQRDLAEAGTGFSRERDRVRLDEAQRLLQDGRLSVTEIGFACGFADSAHFSRQFKQRFGEPPSRFRNHQA